MKKLLLASVAALSMITAAQACGAPTTNRICNTRTYDRAHLAKHPNQTVSAMRISLDSDLPAGYDFNLSVKFRGENDKWQWATGGFCYRFGPGMTCVEIPDGCDTSESNHFYITQNPNALFLYPNRIPLHRGDLGTIGAKEERIPSNERILEEGQDDKIFRLDKAACWKEVNQ